MSGPNFSYAGWSLTFDDEFNSLSLYNGTSGTWQTDYYNGDRTLFGNGELETYVDPNYAGNSDAPLGLDPFSINNGILTITAAPTPSQDLSALNNIPYTSGLLTTESSFAQLYGYFEIRAEVPAGQGLWPAFWLLPLDKSWPPEIDAMEILGQDPTQVYHGSRAVDSSLNTGGSYTGIDASTGFHTYGVLWEPSGIKWYIDGVEVGTAPNSSNTPMYMLTNFVAVGGDWSGAPDSTTQFPAGYQVDYIRAYTLDGGPGGPVPVDGSTPTPSPTPVPTGPNATPDEPRQYVSVDSNGVAFGSSSPSDLFNNADGQTLIGNGGDDVFHVGTYADTTIVENGTGISTVSTWAPVYTLQSGISDLTANGGGSFTLTGNAGDNVITGGTGNDTLDGGGGQDILVGGGGDDTFVMHAGYGALTIADWQGGAGPSDTVQLVGFGITDFATVQQDLTQNDADAVLMLGPGDSITFSNTTIDSFTANDFTFANASPSPAPAPSPNPTPVGSGPVATPTETRQYVSVDSAGVATGSTSPADLYNNADGQTLIGNGGDDVFHIGTYTDTTIVENGTGISTVSTWAPVYTLQSGLSDLTAAGGGAFTLTGNSGDNVITGGTGNDTLDGGGGDDMLTGGGGDDTFVMRQGYGDTTITDFGTSADVVQLVNYGFTDFADVQAAMTQSGSDTVLTLTDGSTLTFQNVSLGNFTAADFALSGGAAASPSPAATPLPTGAFTPTPDESRNYIAPDSTGIAQGTSGDDDLFATADNQTLIGNGGNDVFHLGTNNGVVVSETGTGISEVSTWGSQYILPTGVSNLTGDGGSSHTLTGNAAANVITGDTGNDVLNGGGGNDLLIGGGGNDVYQLASGGGQDTIVNGNGSGAASGELDLGAGIANKQIWLVQSGNDLQIDLMGSTDQATIAGWYSSPAAQLQSIKTASGSVLDTQIGQLVQAMASFQSANPGFDPTQVAQAPNDPSLQSAIAASWHS